MNIHWFAYTGFLLATTAGASTFVVDTTSDTVDAAPDDGICADVDGACSLRAAIQEANATPGADVVVLPAGTFRLALDGRGEDAGALGDLDIGDDMTLIGAGSDATIVDADARDRVIDVLAAVHEVRLEGLTLRNGLIADSNADESGAALRVPVGVHVVLDDVVIRDNRVVRALGAAGIELAGCLEGRHVRVLDNSDDFADNGRSEATIVVDGDFETETGACLVLEDSEISHNHGWMAGAIETKSKSATVTLRRTLISDNEGAAGAMETDARADVLLENVTISGNRGNPGAILNDGGARVRLVNSTVTANGPLPGDIAVVGGIQDVHAGSGLVYLSNTILSGNGPGVLADDCSAANSVGGGNIVGDSARCTFEPMPSDQLDVDPGLAPLADNGGFSRTHLPGAAAIDHGDNASCTDVDQRGRPRPVDGDGDRVAVCDVGAVEIAPEAIFADDFDA